MNPRAQIRQYARDALRKLDRRLLSRSQRPAVPTSSALFDDGQIDALTTTLASLTGHHPGA